MSVDSELVDPHPLGVQVPEPTTVVEPNSVSVVPVVPALEVVPTPATVVAEQVPKPKTLNKPKARKPRAPRKKTAKSKELKLTPTQQLALGLRQLGGFQTDDERIRFEKLGEVGSIGARKAGLIAERTKRKLRQQVDMATAALVRAFSRGDGLTAASVTAESTMGRRVRSVVGSAAQDEQRLSASDTIRVLAEPLWLALDLNHKNQAVSLLSMILFLNSRMKGARKLTDEQLKVILSRTTPLKVGDRVGLKTDNVGRTATKPMIVKGVDGNTVALDPLDGSSAGAEAAQPAPLTVSRDRLLHPDDILISQFKLRQAREHTVDKGAGQPYEPKPAKKRRKRNGPRGVKSAAVVKAVATPANAIGN